MNNLMSTLMLYLREKGYPQSSFMLSYDIVDREYKRHKVDLAVVDITTKDPVMLFQIREKAVEQLSLTEKAGFHGRTVFIQRLYGDKQVPLYYVFPQSNSNAISIYQFAKISDNVEPIPIDIDSSINIKDSLIEQRPPSNSAANFEYTNPTKNIETMVPRYDELVSSSRYEDLNNIQSYQKRLTDTYVIWGYVLAVYFSSSG